MNDLLTTVIDTHGGMDRWRSFNILSADLAAGGPFWERKGWPNLLSDVTVVLGKPRIAHPHAQARVSP